MYLKKNIGTKTNFDKTFTKCMESSKINQNIVRDIHSVQRETKLIPFEKALKKRRLNSFSRNVAVIFEFCAKIAWKGSILSQCIAGTTFISKIIEKYDE